MGGSGAVGGKPASIHDGGSTLASVARGMADRANGFAQAGRSGSAAAGQAELAEAISRFAAAYAEVARGLDAQLGTAGELATNAAADLATAGGGPHPR